MEEQRLKYVLFICDIDGTIDKASDFEIKTLGMYLNKLKELNGADGLIFSLMTGDEDIRYLTKHYKKIVKTLENNNIISGRQYSYYKYYDKGDFIRTFDSDKKSKILNYANELTKKHDLVKIYYADDYPRFTPIDLKNCLTDIDCTFFTPGFDGGSTNHITSINKNISGLLDGLAKHIYKDVIEKEKQHVKVKTYNSYYGDDIPF